MHDGDFSARSGVGRCVTPGSAQEATFRQLAETASAPTRADALAALVRRVRDGDEQAFGELYQATSPVVFGIVLRVLRNRAKAEEVAQEVYLEVWRTAARYDQDRGTTTAWLNVIAHRRAVDCVRSGERASRRDRSFHDVMRWSQEPDPLDVVVARHDACEVRRAVDGLPDVQRHALLLVYFDGRSHREVADILEVPLGTAKSRIRQAMRRLRATFEPDVSVQRRGA